MSYTYGLTSLTGRDLVGLAVCAQASVVCIMWLLMLITVKHLHTIIIPKLLLKLSAAMTDILTPATVHDGFSATVESFRLKR